MRALQDGKARRIDRRDLAQIRAPEVFPGLLKGGGSHGRTLTMPDLSIASFHAGATSRLALRPTKVNLSITMGTEDLLSRCERFSLTTETARKEIERIVAIVRIW